MKIADNNQQEEYKAFLKNIREEREETSNFAKLLFTIVLALLCAVIVCVIIVENNFFLNSLNSENANDSEGFKFSQKQRKNVSALLFFINSFLNPAKRISGKFNASSPSAVFP